MLPPLREELNLHPAGRDAEGGPVWTLHDPARNAFFRLPWDAVEILARWGHGSPEKIAKAVNDETVLTISEEDVQDFGEFLTRNQLVIHVSEAGSQYLLKLREARKQSWGKWLMHHYLFFRVPLVRPDGFLSRTLFLSRPFYTRFFAWMTGIALLAGLFLAGRQWDVFLASFAGLLTVKGALTFALTLPLIKILHELGHAYTTKRYGARVPVMGVAFLLLFPIPYTDTSESWKLKSDRQRFHIAIAGVVAELGVAAWATLAWALLAPGMLRDACFVLATTTWITTLAINLSPFMRFDGYFALMDYWGLPNLHQRAGGLARWKLRELLFGFNDPAPERFTRAKAAKLIIFAWATWTYRLIVFLGIALLVYHFFIKLVGIFLFIIEIYWFILRPVLMELRAWWERKGDMKLRLATIRSLAILALALFWLIAPVTSTVSLPGVYLPAKLSVVYAEEPGRVLTLPVQPGAEVREGETLTQLYSDDVENRLAFSRLQQELATRSAQVAGFSKTASAERQSLLQAAYVAGERRAGAETDLRRLTLTAPASGALEWARPDLRAGDMLAAGEPVFIIRSPAPLRISGYGDEETIARLAPGAKGEFVFDYDPMRVISVTLDHISESPAALLAHPALSSLAGGPVEVSAAEEGLIPTHSQYQLEFSGAAEPVPGEPSLTGTLRVEGERRSRIERFYRAVAAVLIREMNF